MKLRTAIKTLGLSLVSWLLSASVWAAEHGGEHVSEHGAGHDGAALHINWWGFNAHAPALGWLLVDFAIFVFIIYWFGRKPIAAYLQQRSDNIRHALEEAKQAKAEAEARAAELEQRVKELDGELQKLREDIHRLGEKERDRLSEEGKKTAQRMVADAEMQMQNELNSARESLKAEAVNQAIALAEDALRAQLSAADYIRLNAEFVQTLSETQEVAQ